MKFPVTTTPSGQASSKPETSDENIKTYANFLVYFFKMPACAADLFPVIPSGYPPNTHKVSRSFFQKTMAVFMPYYAWPSSFTLHYTLLQYFPPK
jgi:hypothetical protein